MADLRPITMALAAKLDESLAQLDPDARFAFVVWKSDDPKTNASYGDMAFTTNDVPNARKVLNAVDFTQIEDPNAWARVRQ